MAISGWHLMIVMVVWAAIVIAAYSSRRWLTFYLTGALGFVVLAFIALRNAGVDLWIESLEVTQVLIMAQLAGLSVVKAAPTSIGILNDTGWAVFDVGVECSGVLELLALIGLIGFYPAFSWLRKASALAIGITVTWVANLLRILLIMWITSEMGPDWVFQAHAVYGRVFFFAWTIALYWYLVTRPTIAIVGAGLPREGRTDD
jgi:exosortase family protein XrtG